MKTVNTIKELIEELKPFGIYELFLERYDFGFNFPHKVSSLDNLIRYCIHWSGTREGFEYWAKKEGLVSGVAKLPTPATSTEIKECINELKKEVVDVLIEVDASYTEIKINPKELLLRALLELPKDSAIYCDIYEFILSEMDGFKLKQQ